MDVLLKFATNWIIPVIFFLAVFSFLTMIIVELLDARLQLKSRLSDRAIQHILGTKLRDRFFSNVIVDPLGESKPLAYISERIFSMLVMHWLVLDYGFPKKRWDGDWINQLDMARQAIKSLQTESPILANLLTHILDQAFVQAVDPSEFHDFFENEITQWFGHVNKQISKQYQALAGKELMFVGIIVAMLANFDVINMVVSLWKAALIKELADLYDKAGQPLTNIDTSLFTTLPLGWHTSDWTMLLANPIAFALKIFGLGLGGFLIYVCAQYIYDYVKKRTNTITETTRAIDKTNIDKYDTSTG